jgi:hypothetical protein
MTMMNRRHRTVGVFARASAAATVVGLGGCAAPGGAVFKAGDMQPALGPSLATEFPKGMDRYHVRRHAVDLGMHVDMAQWARLHPADAYAPVPPLGVDDYKRWEWAPRAEVEKLSPRATSDFYEVSDTLSRSASTEEIDTWRKPSRAVAMYYDGTDRLERIVVGPMVHLRSDEVVYDGFELYGKQPGAAR